jgi:3'-5' exoribonuclease
MRLIKSLQDVNYSQQEAIEFEATVTDVSNEGLEEAKRPMRVSLKLEETGENFQVISWNFQLLQMLKDAQRSTDIILFEALSGVFSNKQEQIRVGNSRLTGKKSNKKTIKTADVTELKREYNSLINKYISTPFIKKMVEDLVLNNPIFFEWPAATKVHHAYEGGLAVHSLQVTKHAISMWENYQGENLDLEIIVTGALMHDIGKLEEYNKDGSKTLFGELISHIISGAEKICEYCRLNGIDPNRDRKIVILRHIILSHHEKLEFGSPSKPATLEALIVSKADALDASFEGASTAFENISVGEFSDRLLVLDGSKILRWK